MNTINAPTSSKQRRITRLAVDTAVKETLTIRITKLPPGREGTSTREGTSEHPNHHIPLLPSLPGVKNKGQHKNLQQGKRRKVDAAPQTTNAYTQICLIWGY
ncbi:hypothetical protein CBOM_07053 [Ceraceosorus bombacis]|uniref:Uncharacterized protein n=1 Tax=Ceraceosorus bombacis TaxID=401625 RepID=A0A0P1BLF0_9BASI|nr:hypothetical protein CBOM_07053 [Ceraceosorus bombacis]